MRTMNNGKLSTRKLSDTIVKHNYTVSIESPNVATVSGGVLPQAFTIRKLLGEGDANPKTAKNTVPTMGLSLFPADGIGFGYVCAFAKVCKIPCLANQGQGPVPNVQGPRVAKTVLWHLARDWFLAKLNRELAKFRDSVPSQDIAGVRLNMFSDIPWEHYGVIDAHPGIAYYDYTKNPRRGGLMIRDNYWVTFSYDGQNWEDAKRILESGGNVSAVFYNPVGPGVAVCGKAAHRQTLPESFRGFFVIDGGETDWRWDDPRGVIVGLRLLARTYESRNDAIESGFAVRHRAKLVASGA
jgi:hypothetical protein